LVQRLNIDFCPSSSGIDLDGATVGLAFIGTLCGGHSTGIVQVLIFSKKKKKKKKKKLFKMILIKINK